MKAYRVDTAVNAKLQNIINRSMVFNYLRRNPNAYRAQISKELRISAPAVSRSINHLIQAGYVVEKERSTTASGKKAARLVVNSDTGVVIGVDLIKERIRIAVSDFMGRLIQVSEGTRFSEKSDAIEAISDDIDRILAGQGKGRQAGCWARKLKAICIGIPAVVFNKSSERVGTSLYKNLENVDLSQLLSKRYRVPVFVENIVRLSALAEKHYGIAREQRDIVFIEISNGVGAGILIDGQLFRGSLGSAGEIGFSFIGTESLEYRNKNWGYLEKTASVEGMRESALKTLRQGRESSMRELVGGDPEQVSAAIVCTAAAKGDPVAGEIIQTVVSHLAVVFANMILILNPELLVVGGEISTLPHVKPLILDPISRTIQQVIPFKAPPVCLSSLGDDAGVIGASHLAIESLLMRDFPYTMADLPEAPQPR